jgi:hypothetical protein
MNKVKSLYLQEQINKIIEDSFGVAIFDFQITEIFSKRY